MIVNDEKIKCDYETQFVWHNSETNCVPMSRYSPLGYKLGKRRTDEPNIDIAPANCDDELLKAMFFYQFEFFRRRSGGVAFPQMDDSDVAWEVNALRVLRDEMLLRGINPRTTSGKARYAIKGLTI